MSRAPFDTTAQIIWGPAQPTPGVVRLLVDCRFVEQDQITPTPFFFVDRVAWLTVPLDAYYPVNYSRVTVSPVADYIAGDIGMADRVVVDSRPGILYLVQMMELVVPTAGASYYRLWLSETPL